MANSSQNNAGSSALKVIVISAVVAGLASLALGKLANPVQDDANSGQAVVAKSNLPNSQPQSEANAGPQSTETTVATSKAPIPIEAEAGRQADGAQSSTTVASKSAAVSNEDAEVKKPEVAQAEPNIVTGAVSGAKPRYLDAKYNELHFKPGIEKATNEQCLSCHQEIMTRKVRDVAPAGVKANDTLAWYQTLDTYAGNQETFHSRHMTTPLAKEVMKLNCNFCHQGHDPRDETTNTSASVTSAQVGDAMRKMVDPSKSCLLCHGKFPAESMGLEGSWHELREGFEDEDNKNGCLVCHAEQFRTVRHQVNYLDAAAIEKAAKENSSDLCYGCHGGRAWYMNSYPYPRHAWPGMDPETPEWAKNRATESAPEHRLK